MRGLLLLCLFGTVLAVDDYSWNGPGAPGHSEPTAHPTETACESDCGCCFMKKTMHRLEDYFNVSMDELQSRVMKAQAALNDIRSSRSAFSVALTNSRGCRGPFRVGTTVVYEEVFLNLGYGYNPTTGVFTAPRSGVYSLALTVYSDSGAPESMLRACAGLSINNNVVAALNDSNTADHEDSGTVALVLTLTAADVVSVFLPADCSLCDDSNHYNTFSGFLLYATD